MVANYLSKSKKDFDEFTLEEVIKVAKNDKDLESHHVEASCRFIYSVYFFFTRLYQSF